MMNLSTNPSQDPAIPFRFEAEWFDPELLNKYDRPLPRYTSYPPATELRQPFSAEEFLGAIARGNQQQRPLSLYVHIPFCDRPCYFCGCNVIITQRAERVTEPYLKLLENHIDQLSSYVDIQRPVTQLHWGAAPQIT